jgi:hypothetical protein
MPSCVAQKKKGGALLQPQRFTAFPALLCSILSFAAFHVVVAVG